MNELTEGMDALAAIRKHEKILKDIEGILAIALEYPESDEPITGNKAWGLAYEAAYKIKQIKNPHDGSTLNDFLLEEEMQKQEAKKEKKQYERYVVQFYNNYKYSLKWVDQTICLSLEEAKSFVDIYKKQTYTTCDKVRIVHRIVQEEILEEGALNMVEQSI